MPFNDVCPVCIESLDLEYGGRKCYKTNIETLVCDHAIHTKCAIDMLVYKYPSVFNGFKWLVEGQDEIAVTFPIQRISLTHICPICSIEFRINMIRNIGSKLIYIEAPSENSSYDDEDDNNNNNNNNNYVERFVEIGDAIESNEPGPVNIIDIPVINMGTDANTATTTTTTLFHRYRVIWLCILALTLMISVISTVYFIPKILISKHT